MAIRSDSVRPIKRKLVTLPSESLSTLNISCLLRGAQMVGCLAAPIFEPFSWGCSESSSVRSVVASKLGIVLGAFMFLGVLLGRPHAPISGYGMAGRVEFDSTSQGADVGCVP